MKLINTKTRNHIINQTHSQSFYQNSMIDIRTSIWSIIRSETNSKLWWIVRNKTHPHAFNRIEPQLTELINTTQRSPNIFPII